MEWHKCECKSAHEGRTAVILPVSMVPLTPAQEAFLLAHSGHLVCFDCGGEVDDEFRSSADHITGGTVAARLSSIGVIKEVD